MHKLCELSFKTVEISRLRCKYFRLRHRNLWVMLSETRMLLLLLMLLMLLLLW